MIPRYSIDEIAIIWSEEHKLEVWTDIESVHIGDKLPVPDILMVEEREKETRHDVAAFVDCLREVSGRQDVHIGLTSSDVVDTYLAIVTRESWGIVEREASALWSALWKNADVEAGIVGRTHGQPAEEISYYDRITRHMVALQDQLDHIRAVIPKHGKMRGPTGADVGVAEDTRLARWGLKSEGTRNQIVSRHRYVRMADGIALYSDLLASLALDLRLMSRHGEVAEGFGKDQKGSSAMPHKKNPIGLEQVTGFSRIVRGYADMLRGNTQLWEERDISNSCVERVAIPDLFHAVVHQTRTLTRVMENLVVNVDICVSNVDLHRENLVSAEELKSRVKGGENAEEVYRDIQNRR